MMLVAMGLDLWLLYLALKAVLRVDEIVLLSNVSWEEQRQSGMKMTEKNDVGSENARYTTATKISTFFQ